MSVASPEEQALNLAAMAAVLSSVAHLSPEDAYHALTSVANLIVIGAKHGRRPCEVVEAFMLTLPRNGSETVQ